LCNGVTVTAGIDHKISVLGLRAGPAEGTVQRDVSGFLQDGFEAKLVGDGERAEFDHNPPKLAGIGDCLRDILDRSRAGKAGHDDGRIASDLTDVTGDCDVGQRKLGASRGVGIEADHPPPAIDQVSGDRTAHDAKPNDSNCPVHEGSYPSCRIRLTGNARRALISDQAINNHQVASTGQAAFVAMRQMKRSWLLLCISADHISRPRDGRDSEE
jgi:hypothetical protein